MTPFYFGSGARRLFGLYTPGRGDRAVVVCPPWGNEYLAAHRSLRQLDALLAANGWHVLRFDYYGTGDSAGDLHEATLEDWERDIATAMEEVRDASGATRAALVGMRLGGSLAARVAARRPREVSALALWDPVVSGAQFLREVFDDTAGHPGSPEAWGFSMGPAMTTEVGALALSALDPPVAARTLAVVSAPGADVEVTRAALEGRVSGALEVEAIPDTEVWVEGRRFGAAGLPVKVLQRIVEWMR